MKKIQKIGLWSLLAVSIVLLIIFINDGFYTVNVDNDAIKTSQYGTYDECEQARVKYATNEVNQGKSVTHKCYMIESTPDPMWQYGVDRFGFIDTWVVCYKCDGEDRIGYLFPESCNSFLGYSGYSRNLVDCEPEIECPDEPTYKCINDGDVYKYDDDETCEYEVYRRDYCEFGCAKSTSDSKSDLCVEAPEEEEEEPTPTPTPDEVDDETDNEPEPTPTPTPSEDDEPNFFVKIWQWFIGLFMK